MTDGLDSVWTANPHLVVRLRELVAQGKSGGEIARTLKISRNAVIGKIARLNLRLRGMASGNRRRAVLGLKARMTQTDLAEFERPSSPRVMSWETEKRRVL